MGAVELMERWAEMQFEDKWHFLEKAMLDGVILWNVEAMVDFNHYLGDAEPLELIKSLDGDFDADDEFFLVKNWHWIISLNKLEAIREMNMIFLKNLDDLVKWDEDR